MKPRSCKEFEIHNFHLKELLLDSLQLDLTYVF